MAYPQMYGAETVEYQLHSTDEKPDYADIRAKMDDDVRLWYSSIPTTLVERWWC